MRSPSASASASAGAGAGAVASAVASPGLAQLGRPNELLLLFFLSCLCIF